MVIIKGFTKHAYLISTYILMYLWSSNDLKSQLYHLWNGCCMQICLYVHIPIRTLHFIWLVALLSKKCPILDTVANVAILPQAIKHFAYIVIPQWVKMISEEAVFSCTCIFTRYFYVCNAIPFQKIWWNFQSNAANVRLLFWKTAFTNCL